MKPNLKNTLKVILQVAIILVVGGISMWIASLFVSKTKVQPVPAVVTCPNDYNSYLQAKAVKNIGLLSNKSSYGVNGSFAGHDYTVSLKRTGLNSQIACGYLFYKISVGNKPIEQKYENLRMLPTDSKQFGGQILPNEKTAVSINEVANKTEILIPLNNIPYDGTDRINIKQADWASLLNVADQISFDIALNTISPLGRIDSVEIAYKCWNPQTGQETNDCNLELAK